METTVITSTLTAIREGKRIIWWNVIIGLCAAIALYAVTPPYQIFIAIFLAMRLLAIAFEYMLYVAFKAVSTFTNVRGILYAWGVAFVATVLVYTYEVCEAAFHYGMSVSPYYQIPPNIFQSIEGIALLFLGFYFGRLPYGYGKLAFNVARSQRVTDALSVRGGLSGQFASKNLDPSEKLVLGGLRKVEIVDLFRVERFVERPLC